MAATHFKGPLTITNGPLTIGAAVLTEAQIEALDDLDTTELAALEGITPGTAAASKALIADSNIDVAGVRNFTVTGSFIIGSADMDETDLEKLDGITNGTSAASKAVVLDASSKINALDITALTLNGTALGSTAAEIDRQCDISLQTETIAEGGVVSVTKRYTKIVSTGAGAVTIAAPDASSLGQVKVIEMTGGEHDVTLALTNVQGGSAATTATFSDINDTLVLVAGTLKWNVVGEAGVVLS